MKARASAALCAFVHQQAPPHYVSADAPSSWVTLRDWYHNAEGCGVFPPFAVYDGGCENTIYPDAETNHAFRAWHDLIHCQNQYSFNYASEVKVGLIHMQQARRHGLAQSDLDLLIADTIGQATYYQAFERYVNLQDEFVYDVIADGLNATIARGPVY